MALPYPKVHVVINPAAGQNEPILNVLNDVFHPAGVRWDISLTHKSGDATRLAAAAAASGADLIAAYGGDGTQMEVANGLLGTGVPQAILPGGTGNAMAHELNVPINLRQAAELIVTSQKRCAVDLAKIGEQIFMLRAYCGLSAENAASRESKDKYGQLAYVQAGLKFIRNVPETHYRATIDGEVIEGEALIVFILNAGSIGGVMGIEIPEVGDVDVSDGYLDLYAITKGIKPLRAISKYLLHRENDDNVGVYCWKGKEISIEAATEQDVWIDGELGGKTPFTITTLPQALEIVVPD
ncbi:MAG: diacylglycerol/lipid kinase family protein [Anaerolineales bacterium]|jgi:YegS/Rv2252/BmrU family lipid kinase